MPRKKKVTYEELIPILNNKHFYPKMRREGGKIIALEEDCPPILRDSRKEVLEKALEGFPVDIEFFGNGNDYLQITIK